MLRLVLLMIALLSPVAAGAEGYISRTLNYPVPGGIAVVPLGNLPDTPRVTYKNNKVMVVRDSDAQWVAVVGIDLKTSEGVQTLSIRNAGSNRSASFNVGSKAYKEQHIKLKNKSHVNPDPEQTRRFEREYAKQMEAYQQFRDVGPSNILLDRPVNGRLSSPFGLRRFFNGQERNAHSGLDFAVPSGTAVKAPADGVVTIVDDFFFNGKTIFIDHGQGLITMYCHLSEF
ncbi:MAG TPA: peptidoglycan DD-metalloendopeptidase family protein, partial [Eoetvoesiella sp.]